MIFGPLLGIFVPRPKIGNIHLSAKQGVSILLKTPSEMFMSD